MIQIRAGLGPELAQPDSDGCHSNLDSDRHVTVTFRAESRPGARMTVPPRPCPWRAPAAGRPAAAAGGPLSFNGHCHSWHCHCRCHCYCYCNRMVTVTVTVTVTPADSCQSAALVNLKSRGRGRRPRRLLNSADSESERTRVGSHGQPECPGQPGPEISKSGYDSSSIRDYVYDFNRLYAIIYAGLFTIISDYFRLFYYKNPNDYTRLFQKTIISLGQVALPLFQVHFFFRHILLRLSRLY
jgi:hypothetical protein